MGIINLADIITAVSVLEIKYRNWIIEVLYIFWQRLREPHIKFRHKTEQLLLCE